MSEEKKNKDKRGPEEVKEILRAVSEELPELINKLMESVYSEEAGRKIGRSVGALYQELVEAGIEKEEALKMARDYFSPLKNITKQGSGGGFGGSFSGFKCDHDDEDDE